MSKSSLPQGWKDTAFEYVVTSMSNGYGGKQNKDGVGIPVSRIETIANESFNFEKIGFIENYDEQKVQQYRLKKNEILFSHINSPIHLGKTAVFDSERELFHGINLLRIIVNEQAIVPRLFNYYCKYSRAIGNFSLIAQHAVNQSSLNQTKLKAFEIPLPPFNEQNRIANKLDELLTQVDTIKARVDAIPEILKRFRRSVLAAAVTGKLTEEWRDNNGVSYSTWEAKKLGEIVGRIEAGKNLKCIERPPVDSEHGIIKISAVTWGTYNENESKTLPQNDLFIENRRIQIGDFLISRANTIELLGNPVIVQKVTKNLMISDKVLRLVMDDRDKSWVSIFLRSFDGRKEIESRATGNQQSMRNIGQKALLDIDLPKPSREEQMVIVKQVEMLFSFSDQIEQRVKEAQARIDNLSQSVLAKAFRGELVPQDPNDEPASVLLERIKQEREEVAKLAKAAKKAGKKAVKAV